MERTAWTDERLDDLCADVRALRDETARRFDALDRRIDSLGTELRGEIGNLGGGLRGEIEGLRLTILRVGGGMMVGLVGVIAAVLARGV